MQLAKSQADSLKNLAEYDYKDATQFEERTKFEFKRLIDSSVVQASILKGTLDNLYEAYNFLSLENENHIEKIIELTEVIDNLREENKRLKSGPRLNPLTNQFEE